MIPKVSGKILTGPMALLGFVCAFWFFRNAVQLNRFTREWTWIAIVFEVLFPIVLFVFLRPRKKGAQHSPSSNSDRQLSDGKQERDGKHSSKPDQAEEQSKEKKQKDSHGSGNLQPS